TLGSGFVHQKLASAQLFGHGALTQQVKHLHGSALVVANQPLQTLNARLIVGVAEELANVATQRLELAEMALQLLGRTVALGTRACEQRATQGPAGRAQLGVGTTHLIQTLQLEVVHLRGHAIHAIERCEPHRADDRSDDGHEYEADRQSCTYRETGKPVHRSTIPSKK